LSVAFGTMHSSSKIDIIPIGFLELELELLYLNIN